MSLNHFTNSQISDSVRGDFCLEMESMEDIIQYSSNWQMYQLDDVSQISFQQSQSTILCKNIIESIIDKGSQKMFEAYIRPKLTNYLIFRTFNQLEFSFQIVQKQQYDDIKTSFQSPDNEPVQPDIDHWRRFNAYIKKKEIDDQQDPHQSTERTSNVKNNQATYEPIKTDQKYKLIDYQEPEPFDHEIETLRTLKERERRNKEQKLMTDQQRDKELKEQQKQMKMNENKNLFTYDFDGRIIPLKTIAIEKLADTYYNSKHNLLKEQQIIKLKIDPNQNKDILKDQVDRKRIPKQTLIIQESPKNTQNVFDKFTLNKGVTLFQNGKVTEGPPQYFEANINQLKDQKLKVKLTKKQYQEIINKGNLQRSKILDITQQQKQENLNQSSILNPNELQIQNESKATNFDQHKRQKTEKDQIQVKSKYQMSLYLDGIKNDEDQSFLHILNTKSNIGLSNQKTQKIKIQNNNILDNFNRSILTKSHEIKGGLESFTLPLINSSKDQDNQSLGQLSKYPRNRISKIASQALSSFSHLPPPSYGNSMGHGINSGYNPSNLNEFDTILNKINNKSILKQ